MHAFYVQASPDHRKQTPIPCTNRSTGHNRAERSVKRRRKREHATPLQSTPASSSSSYIFSIRLHNVEALLQLLDQLPFIHADVRPEVVLERVYALTRDKRVQRVLFFQVTAVERLVGPLDLDSDGRLTLFADGDLLVLALDRGAVFTLVRYSSRIGERDGSG
jgi:hypothetical protein